MNKRPIRSIWDVCALLKSLARNVRGNTLILMTAALIPLAGMVGGGIDISRMYILKTRLQHACDAGALAGRKAMGGGTWTHTGGYPGKQADMFFKANFETGSFGSSDLKTEFKENAGKVTGVVSAKIPMTLMKIFKQPDATIPVSCDAEMRLPNTDVMFVLDTTGSMTADAGGGETRIEALRVAVKCFYEIVARLDTNADCTTGQPSGGTGNQVQIRFGFVPYSSNVNVGKLLPTAFFADTWEYQTRERRMNTDPNNFTWVQKGASRTIQVEQLTQTGVPQASCTNAAAAAAGYNSSVDNFSNGNTVKRTVTKIVQITGWTTPNGGTCRGNRPEVETFYDKVPNEAFVGWRYAKLPITVGSLKNGNIWNNSFQWPIENGGGNRTLSWDGCIEERQTDRATVYTPRPSKAKDLDIDLVPSAGDPESLWGPALRGAIYTRRGSNRNTWNRDPINTDSTTNYGTSFGYNCPTESRLLQSWTDATQFSSYVDSLATNGTTYHDIGLLWGGRLLSPTGIFAADNDFTPQGGEIERHLIFMTDGITNANDNDYNAYGVPWFDRRQTPDGAVPSKAQLDAQVDARFSALCTMIKDKKITLWVIGFGDEISASASTQLRLTTCATAGRYFLAEDSKGLQATFKNIADQISMLRLTK